MIFKPRLLLLPFLLVALVLHPQPAAQMGVLHGRVTDPSGAAIPGARIAFSRGGETLYAYSGADGRYAVRIPAPASYTIKVTAKGFEPYLAHDVQMVAGHSRQLNLAMELAIVHQEVTVAGRVPGVGIGTDQNSSSMVFRGRDLNALSDDPAELQSELQALAAATAGPNGGQIYIDGFAGGQLPPKSSILEIRVNQNPFSAEYDRVGYGRVEIITKPGSEKMHGTLSGSGNTSATNTANPLVAQQPEYNFYAYSGNISGPIGKKASYFLSAFRMDNQSQNVIDALNPQNPSASLTEAVPYPSSNTILNPRLDIQVGKHTLTFNDYFYRLVQTGSSVGALSLPEQAVNGNYKQESIRFSDATEVNARLLNEVHFEWQRVRNDQSSSSPTPALLVSGAFMSGGNNLGILEDHQDILELQNYMTASAGYHTFRFGARVRAYRDANYSTAGSNGTYTFSSLAAYQASQPTQYTQSVINNPLARVWLMEGSAFFQDDWRVKPNLMLGLGARWEGQNWIHDHSDWAPRLALAWSPGRPGSDPAKTVIRAGYGWFYNRFAVPGGFSSVAGVPYVVEAIHDNRVHQQSYVVNNPCFYSPNAPVSQATLASCGSAVPVFHSVDPHFKTALNMQTGAGIDQQISRRVTANVTYLYTQGVHQYLSNNVTAPAFNAATYTAAGAAPPVYNYQYQSGGFFRQSQIILTSSVQTTHFVLNGNYIFNLAKSDTQGVNSFVSVAQNPGLDYGRASFGMRHQVTLLNSYTAPFGFVLASFLAAQTGIPYNLTTGYDLTGNNQFNARPAYGVCGAAGVVSTRYGCLDPNPAGKGERMVPFGVATGPANLLLDTRLSKTIGVGPRIKSALTSTSIEGDSGSNTGLSSGAASVKLDEGAPRRYNLTFIVGASNLLNIVNLGVPNGVLISPLFGKSQSLADGSFANATPGNRAFSFEVNLSF